MNKVEVFEQKGHNIDEFHFIRSFNFDEYMEFTKQLAAANTTTGPVITEAHIMATKLNLARMNRLVKTCILLPAWNSVTNAGIKLKWLIIAEPWCNDGGQIVPVICKIAKHLDIETQIILRDEHPVIMDQYQFRNTRSIPMLICFDQQTGDELDHWGPRPATAQLLADHAKSAGLDHDATVVSLQNWYNQNKTVSLQNELFSFVTACLS